MDKGKITEQTAIVRAISGDEQGYLYLLEKYKAFAYSIAVQIVKNEQNAEEVVQDSFIKAFKSIAKFKKLGKFSTWLYKIVYHTSLTSIRGKKNIVEYHAEYTDYILDIPDNYSNGFEKLLEKDKEIYLNKAIEKLVESERMALTLYYTNQCTIKEMQDIMGWKPSTIKTRLFRGRQHLYVELSNLLNNELNDLR